MIISLGLIGLFLIMPNIKPIYAVYCAVILVAAHIIFTAFICYQYSKGPLGGILNQLSLQMTNEQMFINDLMPCSIFDINNMADRLEAEYNYTDDFDKSIIGEIRRIGFLPGLIIGAAALAALYSAVKNYTVISDKIIYVAVILISAYILIFLRSDHLRKLKLTVFLMRKAVKLKERDFPNKPELHSSLANGTEYLRQTPDVA